MLEPQIVGKDFGGWQTVELALAEYTKELLDAGVFLRILFDELFDTHGGFDISVA